MDDPLLSISLSICSYLLKTYSRKWQCFFAWVNVPGIAVNEQQKVYYYYYFNILVVVVIIVIVTVIIIIIKKKKGLVDRHWLTLIRLDLISSGSA